MKKLTEYIGSQFGNPRGPAGKLCCLIMNTINRSLYRGVISCVKADAGSTILDVGCGNGYLIRPLYRKSGAAIYGIDISGDMLKIAVKKNRKAVGERKIHLLTADCCDLPFWDNRLDIVTSVNTIYFWGDTAKGLSEICRTLKDGGVFYNAVYAKEWLQKLSYTRRGFQFFEKSDYIELGKKAGFSRVSMRELSPGKSYIVKYVK